MWRDCLLVSKLWAVPVQGFWGFLNSTPEMKLDRLSGPIDIGGDVEAQIF